MTFSDFLIVLSTAFPALSVSNKDKAQFLETLISFQANINVYDHQADIVMTLILV